MEQNSLYGFWANIEAIAIRRGDGYGPSDEDMARLKQAILELTDGWDVAGVAREQRLKAAKG